MNDANISETECEQNGVKRRFATPLPLALEVIAGVQLVALESVFGRNAIRFEEFSNLIIVDVLVNDLVQLADKANEIVLRLDNNAAVASYGFDSVLKRLRLVELDTVLAGECGNPFFQGIDYLDAHRGLSELCVDLSVKKLRPHVVLSGNVVLAPVVLLRDR